MVEEKDKQYIEDEDEMQIDWLGMLKKAWEGRMFILKCCILGIVVGLIAAFSIPKEYSTSVNLASESGASGAGGLSSLAAMAGINIGSSRGSEALTPDLYPNIVSSTPFTLELFNTQVTSLDGKLKTNLYDYLHENVKEAWWNYIIAAPKMALGLIRSLWKKDNTELMESLKKGQEGYISLTEDQRIMAKALNERIGISVDKRTNYTTISVKMQDPLIAATVADTVTRFLQKYITDYRTNKAKKDLQFSQEIYNGAKRDYELKQAAYAAFADANQNLILQKSRAELERLQNDRNLAMNVYTQSAQQLQLAQAKVQEETPVLTVVQPAVVPLQGSPSKLKVLVIVTFLFFAFAVAWEAIGKEYFWKYWNLLKETLKN